MKPAARFLSTVFSLVALGAGCKGAGEAPAAPDGLLVPLDLEEDSPGVVQNPAAERFVCRKAVDERSESDPLNRPLDLDPQSAPYRPQE